MFTADISKIPTNAGVYLFKDRKGIILYIGKAKNLQKRL
jgi:excinuclease UvrABC nuclease subunit